MPAIVNALMGFSRGMVPYARPIGHHHMAALTEDPEAGTAAALGLPPGGGELVAPRLATTPAGGLSAPQLGENPPSHQRSGGGDVRRQHSVFRQRGDALA